MKEEKTMTRVVRLTNPEAFKRDEVQALFREAFESNMMATYDKAIGELVAISSDPLVALLVGAEKGELRGLVIACLPRSTLTATPSVYHFYNSGSAKLREALVKATVDFFLEAGYTRFWAINTLGDNDEAYAKLFRSAGEARRLGSFLEFSIG